MACSTGREKKKDLRFHVSIVNSAECQRGRKTRLQKRSDKSRANAEPLVIAALGFLFLLSFLCEEEKKIVSDL